MLSTEDTLSTDFDFASNADKIHLRMMYGTKFMMLEFFNEFHHAEVLGEATCFYLGEFYSPVADRAFKNIFILSHDLLKASIADRVSTKGNNSGFMSGVIITGKADWTGEGRDGFAHLNWIF
jgi:hypothetical protein